MTPEEAATFLRLDQTGHTPTSARRTLDYWRDKGELRATKYARRVWYLRRQLGTFLRNKTEDSIPLPEQTVSLLTAWQSVAPEGCPYVLMEHELGEASPHLRSQTARRSQ